MVRWLMGWVRVVTALMVMGMMVMVMGMMVMAREVSEGRDGGVEAL